MSAPLPEGGSSPPLVPRSPEVPLDVRVGNADRALQAAWRLLNAGAREAFVATAPPALRRVAWCADDGVRGALFHVPAAPGTRGEPVLFVHGLGGSWRDLALEGGLAWRLAQDGFSVYLLAHRGDRDADAAGGASLDDVAIRDLPAAIDAVKSDAGATRVLALGHGLGAHALLLHRALLRDQVLAGMVLIGASGRFRASTSSQRALAQVMALLPGGWTLRMRSATQLAVPFVGDGAVLGSPDTPGPAARAHVLHAEGVLSGGILAQVARWFVAGHPTDQTGRLDVLAAVTPMPALVVAAEDDPWCLPADALPVAEALGGAFFCVAGGAMDPLLGARSVTEVFPRVAAFLHAHRDGCWTSEETRCHTA